MILGFILIAIGLITFLLGGQILRRDHLRIIPRASVPRQNIAVLIPARDESAVIPALLDSLRQQTIKLDPQNIYVIVESLNDKTVAICQKHHVSVVVRNHPEKQRKGYALHEAIQAILKSGKHYDVYFIFDADNTMNPDYLEKMLLRYEAGYQMAAGYRGIRNQKINVIAAVSSLTFTMINTLGNRKRTKLGANIIFSGTGCFVDGALVEEWRGWPFHSLTEDYEMSLYAMLHHIPTCYSERAVFYDEQPTRYAQTAQQRLRWIKGYFSARHQYLPELRAALKTHPANRGSILRELIGVKPLILMIIGAAILLVGGAMRMFGWGNINWLWLAVGTLLVVYLALMVVTVVLLSQEKLPLSAKVLAKTIFFNPIYLLTYIGIAIQALFTREVTWQKIEHKKDA